MVRSRQVARACYLKLRSPACCSMLVCLDPAILALEVALLFFGPAQGLSNNKVPTTFPASHQHYCRSCFSFLCRPSSCLKRSGDVQVQCYCDGVQTARVDGRNIASVRCYGRSLRSSLLASKSSKSLRFRFSQRGRPEVLSRYLPACSRKLTSSHCP